MSGGDHCWFKGSTGKKRHVTRDDIITITIIIIIIVRVRDIILLFNHLPIAKNSERGLKYELGSLVE